MSDSGTGIDHVDQGTIVMLTLTFVLGISVSFWFACNWYVKKRRKEAKDVTPSASEVPVEKTRVKQTFSRFSQVDEEVTMAIDEDDEAILKQAAIKASQKTNDISVPKQQNEKKYLETDL
ncbi:uncharacterized protein LOC127853616 isoform X2 [Dreissena polymorpha]|uniref:Uncharacterized protein n=1 Tax=Dreissena polymorpha TaxID=45954 RepID=A0A9D4HQQ2_DREPO|nr:uncharacterized protein LOC127853616 isoform X2 [Dreissena polymorpha]KAH3727510.1 hypothetical protein DPMN_053449 [Dreissena polymorpha]